MKILVVEDDAALKSLISSAITSDGMIAETASDGEEAQYLGETGVYDAIVLDLGLPKRDGLSVLRAWRAANISTPVLILTARGRWPEKRDGFNAGADDYLTKPFNPEEVVLRLRALIRRSAGFATAVLRCGAITLDPARGHVAVSESPVQLTTQEFRILEYLMHRKGQIVSRLELIDHIYGYDGDPDSNVLDVLIARIRRKIGAHAIATVRGRGYRLAESQR